MGNGAIDADRLTPDKLLKVKQLAAMATARGQTLAQMALAWVLRDPRVTSALTGASRPQQVLDSVKALENLAFTPEELAKIEVILAAQAAANSSGGGAGAAPSAATRSG